MCLVCYVYGVCMLCVICLCMCVCCVMYVVCVICLCMCVCWCVCVCKRLFVVDNEKGIFIYIYLNTELIIVI